MDGNSLSSALSLRAARIVSCLLLSFLVGASIASSPSSLPPPSPSSSSPPSSPSSSPFSPSSSLIWGPGLLASFNVPSRFFFIQAVGQDGSNITESLGQDFFKISVTDQDGHPGRVWAQLLDRGDGSYIVRFRLWRTHVNLRIAVKDNKGNHVGKSPFALEGASYPENCDCPEPDLFQWQEDMECAESFEQIKRDFSQFPSSLDMSAIVSEAISRFSDPQKPSGSHSICHYVVKDNRVFRTCYGQHVGFKMFSDAILLSITGKVLLPDFEFVINLGDWPLEKKKGKDALPIVSWCGSDSTRDIILPTYDLTNSVLETQGRVTLDLLSVQKREPNQRWEEKIEKGFFRGRDARQERLDLAMMAKKNPDLLDVGITNYFFFRDGEEEKIGKTEHVSFFDFFKYKYQLNVDGTVAAYRFPYLLAGNSVVLKQESSYYEHFYKDLKPWVHYVPVKRNLKDVVDTIQHLKENDELAQKISRAGADFTRQTLMSNHVFCYHVEVFNEFAKRAKEAPRVREGMEEVKRDKNEHREMPCECLRSKEQKGQKVEL